MKYLYNIPTKHLLITKEKIATLQWRSSDTFLVKRSMLTSSVMGEIKLCACHGMDAMRRIHHYFSLLWYFAKDALPELNHKETSNKPK